MSEQRMQTFRRSLAKCLPGSRGPCALKRAVAKRDPTIQIPGCPIQSRSVAVWEGSPSIERMVQAWRTQVVLGLRPEWNKVQGPTAAAVISLRRAELTWPAFTHACMRGGHLIDLRVACPCDVIDAFKCDAEAVHFSRWTRQGTSGGWPQQLAHSRPSTSSAVGKPGGQLLMPTWSGRWLHEEQSHSADLVAVNRRAQQTRQGLCDPLLSAFAG